MSASTHLAEFGVSVSQARTFVLNNLNNLQHIINVCAQYGVTNSMLAEIYGGVTESQVITYFSSRGFDSTLLDNNSYERLSTGSYVATGHNHYYSLNLTEGENIFLSLGGGYSDSAIYDSGLNYISDISRDPMYLDAGSYIVHAQYQSYSNSALNTYIPQLTRASDIVALDTGSYAPTTFSNFYSLNLTKGENVFLSMGGGYSDSAIYDTDLNYIADISRDPMYLDAGNYIVHARYQSYSSSALNTYIPQLTEASDIVSLDTGSYAPTTFSNFYSLSLTKGENVFLSMGGGYSDSAIYDTDLNYIADISRDPMYLDAGDYIVHARYQSYSRSELNTYIPQLTEASDIIELSAGTYKTTNYDNFFSLDLDTAENVFIKLGGGYTESAIYDSDLNFVADINNETLTLGAGDYIIHAAYTRLYSSNDITIFF